MVHAHFLLLPRVLVDGVARLLLIFSFSLQTATHQNLKTLDGASPIRATHEACTDFPNPFASSRTIEFGRYKYGVYYSPNIATLLRAASCSFSRISRLFHKTAPKVLDPSASLSSQR